ncbi:hypothetical protein IAU59_005028 [Kwoniella sp. CBS 9459]
MSASTSAPTPPTTTGEGEGGPQPNQNASPTTANENGGDSESRNRSRSLTATSRSSAPASASASTGISTLAIAGAPLFPPTPSRTTSKLSITSVDSTSHFYAHSPNGVNPNDGTDPKGVDPARARNRTASTPNSKSTSKNKNMSGPSTPTKSGPGGLPGGAAGGGGGGGNVNASARPTLGLLGADPSSPALRARASTASSRTGSIYDDLPSSRSRSSMSASASASASVGASSSSSTSVDKQKQVHNDVSTIKGTPAAIATAADNQASSSSNPSSSSSSSSSIHSSRSTPRSRKGKERALAIDDSELDPAAAAVVGEAEQTELGLDSNVDASLAETLTQEGEMGVIDATQDDVDVRKGLRDLVRRSTVTQGQADSQRQKQGSLTANDIEQIREPKDESSMLPPQPNGVPYFTPRKYYALTHAGKPVFSSHDDSSDDNITNLMGIAQALISIFAEQDDKIRCILKGRSKIAFLLKAPLYLFCVSDWGEPEHVLRSHLEYIHLHILSVVSSTQLSRVFQRRSNFDLSRLLEGTETFLNKLIERAQYDFSYLTSTLQPLRMNPAIRENAAAALMPPSKFKDLLYVLLIAGGHIVTLLRPRKHSIHPSDLHLLLNTLASSPTLRASETWLPICFPKFNPAGFVHAYISYVMDDVGLVFVSADREAFEELRGWKEIVLAKLEHDKTLGKIKEAIPVHPYPISAIGCPGLRHFIYKSRIHVQITQPEWEAPYTEDSEARKRLITLYQKLHDAVHARSGQSAPLKLVYLKTEHEACLAWLTKPFELYLTVSPQLSKSAVVAAANAVAKWVLAEEGRVFLKDAPVF